MQILVNGETTEVPAGTTVAEVVARRGLPPQVVAVEVNQELVPRAEREAWSLVEGDRVELVTLVGGG